jgi:dynein heavy chain
LKVLKNLWNALKNFDIECDEWKKMKFSEIDTEHILNRIDEYYTHGKKAEMQFDDSGTAIKELLTNVSNFKEIMLVINDLNSEDLNASHWDRIQSLFPSDVQKLESKDYPLSDLLAIKAYEHQKIINEIALEAKYHKILKDKMSEVISMRDRISFTIINENDQFRIFDKLDTVVEKIEECQSKLNFVLASRYVRLLKSESDKKDKIDPYSIKSDLDGCLELIEDIKLFQRMWRYLSNIINAHGSGDLKKNVPETNIFEKIDTDWRNQMSKLQDTTPVINYYQKKKNSGQEHILQKHLNDFEKIQLKIEEYLTILRTRFERFFFISNDDLLYMLSNSSTEKINLLKPYLMKIFEDIAELTISKNDGSQSIPGVFSMGREELVFEENWKQKSVKITETLDEWLSNLEKTMVATLKEKTYLAFQAFSDVIKDEAGHEKWLEKISLTKDNNSNIVNETKNISQVIATVCHIMFCQNTQESISSIETLAWKAKIDLAIQSYSKMVNKSFALENKTMRKIISNLITHYVHYKDICVNLVKDDVQSIDDFTWQQQLRAYMESSEAGQTPIVKIRQLKSELEYGYEYIGPSSRIVITPLTDRVWLTMTAALKIRLGCSLGGPAGTGKTETTKDLAKFIGIQCIVYNCSEQTDYKLIGNILSGICAHKYGAYACFDEFNRINVEVLSVVATQLFIITQALLTHDTNEPLKKVRILSSCEVNLIGKMGCFITMNPTYSGRTELPDNLKSSFRPITMMVPELAKIAEVRLASEGFGEISSTLAVKLSKLYELAPQQLSQQDHYDFTLRSLGTVLTIAGSFKRSQKKLNDETILVNALRDANLPKFLPQDIQLFKALLSDLFPKVVLEEHSMASFENELKKIIVDEKLHENEYSLKKCVEIFDILNIKLGVCLTGSSGTGKSTCLNLTSSAITNLKDTNDPRFKEVEKHYLNPKSISMGELFGHENEDTKTFVFGLLTIKIKEVLALDEFTKYGWVCLDGPIDTKWIENMNSVLDDSMVFCLSNGERIKLKHHVKIFFEVEDLSKASLATVSRLGVVYFVADGIGWKPYVHSWIKKHFVDETILTKELKEYLIMIFEDKMEDALDNVNDLYRSGAIFIKPVPVQCVQSTCNFLEVLLTNKNGFIGRNFENLENVDVVNKIKRKILNVFAFATVWGVFGCVNNKGLHKVESFVKTKFLEIKLENMLFMESHYDFNKNDFVAFSPESSAFNYVKDMPYFSIFVPTLDTVRYSFLFEHLIEAQKNVFITGETGVGKTSILLNTLEKMALTEDYAHIGLNFSAQTTSVDTQKSLESKLEPKKGRRVLGAKSGKKLTIFIDDINMPEANEWGAHPPIELLRQYLDYGGFWDRTKFFWKIIEDSCLFVCGGPPIGGRSKLTDRFGRHFNFLCLPQPNRQILISIFEAILKGFLSNFTEKVKNTYIETTTATIELFEFVVERMKPIPAKFHYIFNLRDVSKIVQGLLMSTPISIKEKETFIKLWTHESCRVFGDRLIAEEDVKMLHFQIADIVKSKFKMEKMTYDSLFKQTTICFGEIHKGDVRDGRPYEEIVSVQNLIKNLEYFQDMFNKDKKSAFKLVFFDYAILHILRISRVLRQPRGNMVCIGHGGNGKQTLTKFAARTMYCDISTVSKDYRKDLKEIIKNTGSLQKKTLLLLTDSTITSNSLLEDVNNLLNIGEIPNLYPQSDELQAVLNQLAPYMKAQGIPETREKYYETFVSQTRENLHIVICTSPVGESLRLRFRKFPALINCCTLNWFINWPQEALISCCKRAFQNFPYDEKVKETFVSLSTNAHRDLEELTIRYFSELSRKVYVTPKSFLDMIGLLLNLVGQKKDEMDKKICKFKDGVEKLEITHANIQTLEKQLTILEPEITKKETESQDAYKRANVEKEKAEAKSYEVREKSAQVAKLQAELRQKTQKVESKKNEIETNLSETWEEIQNELTADNLLRLQKTTNLGDKRKIILQAAVHLLRGKKIDAQNEILNVLSNEKKRILDFQKEIDEDKVNEAVMKQFQTYYTTHIPKVFDCLGQEPDTIKEIVLKSQSPPITTIYKWGAGCIYAYEQTKTYLFPTKAEKILLDAEKVEKEKECQKLNEDFSIMQESIQKLTNEQDSIAKTLEELKKQKFQTSNRKNNAVKLIGLLKDEGERWRETVEVLTKEMENFLGNMFISALSVSYLSPFTGVYRKEQVDNWIYTCFNSGVKVNRDFVLENFLSDPVQIRNWNICGLPSDSVSVQNGIMLFNSPKYPLLIDPQLQGNKWLKKLFKNKLNLLKGEMTFKDESSRNKMINSIALDISKGNSILVENILEEIDNIFQPLINKNIIIEGSSRSIEFHLPNPIEFHPKFQIYFTTKLANPHYPPEYFIKLNIINFTVTFEGLNEQLLGEVFKYEKRDKYELRDSIIETMGKCNAELVKLSSDILIRISEAKSDTILDDEELIKALQEAKKVSDDVKEKVRENSFIEKEINLVRNEYIPVAIRGSVLYFVIVDLGMIDSMYQFSLEYFKKVFSFSIKKAKQSEFVKERVAILEKAITEDIYKNTKRGIFESHKTLFSFLIAIYIKRKAKLISEEDWNLFLKGPISFNKEEMPENPDKTYFSEFAWDTLLFTEIHYELQGMTKKISEQFYKFKIFFDNLKNFSDFAQYFSDYPKVMENNFLKLLLIKIFRLDLLPIFIKSYIREELGNYFIDTSPTKLDEVYEDSDEKTPIIFILSQGADPTSAFLEFQSRFVIETEDGPRPQKYINISLGQGQEHEAKIAILEEGVKHGTWVMLQNCHLFTTWMGELAQIVNSLGEDESEEGINKNFRLWLTSMPNKNFPVSILQNSLKMTTEPPSGVKNNIKKIFDQLKDEKLSSNKHPEAFPKLVFSLSLFHSVIQERKKFGPIGFNIRYDFNFADFDTSTKLVKVYLDESEDIPWPCVEYLVGEVNYGGRVTDDFDRITMQKTLNKFLTEKLLEREKDENGEEIENGPFLRYNFTKSGCYWAPAYKTIEEYNTYIESMPFIDEPDLFGLHENANIVYQLQESNKIQSLLLNVIPKTTNSGKSFNEVVFQLVNDLLISRPDKIELKDQRHKSHDKTFKNNLKHSLTIVMEQEIEKFNRLLMKIGDSLTNIKSAIEGTVTLSSEGDEIYNSLLVNRIPASWAKICYPSHKPLSSWYSDFIQRIEVIRTWVQSGHPPCFWLSGFFYPQGFLTGVLQNHAREHEIPVSDIIFKFQVINKPVSEIPKGPPDGVYIHGLFLEAASWDSFNGILVDPKPGEMSFRMPVIHFQTQEKRDEEDDELEDEDNEDSESRIHYYNCPAFKTLKRTQIISASGRSDNHVTFIVNFY